MPNNIFSGPFNFTSAAINAALAGQGLNGPSFVNIASSGYYAWGGQTVLRAPVVGGLALRNFAETITAEMVTEANDILAQRRGTNPQTQRLYNTFTDSSNYERANLAWTANVFEVSTFAAGTGINRILRLVGAGTTLDITQNDVEIYRNNSSTQTILSVMSTGLTSTALLHTRLMPSINQASGTYTVLDINPTETAIGAGPHYLMRGRIGAGNNVFSFDRTGALTLGDIASNGVMLKNNGGVELQVYRADGTTITGVRASVFRTMGGTYASIGAPGGQGAGTIAYITDATATTRQSIAAGGGSNKVLVYSDGTNWLIV